MAGTANASSSLEHFFETSLKKLFLELHHNMSAVGGSPERRLAERDSVGPVVYIMVFIAILSFFIISLLVIAVKSRSYEQQPDHQQSSELQKACLPKTLFESNNSDFLCNNKTVSVLDPN
uniref:Uncharacterized protein n=1 Tax=Xenopus tropicalis TaxID=8364 RepID=A0A6I8RPB6_XENTR